MVADMSEQDIVTEIRVAAAAAQAARATPGVVRLQPNLWGLVRRFSQQVWERVTGKPYPDVAGVEVQLDDESATIELTLVTDGRHPAASIAAAAQRAVVEAVTTQTGLAVTSVAVHVCEIDITHRGQPAPTRRTSTRRRAGAPTPPG